MKMKRGGIIVMIELLLLAYMILAMRDFTVFAVGLFWDLRAFILIVTFPFGIILLNYSFRMIAGNISLPFDKGKSAKDDLERGIIFFDFAVKSYLYSGMFLFFFALMMMLSDISSVDVIGRNLATALCAIIYSLLIIILFLVPMKNRLEMKLADLK